MHSLDVVSAASLLPVFVFQTFQMLWSYILLSHALCSMSRQKLWTGEIHRKSHQFYCQGDFSWISLTEEFLTSYPFRWGIQLEMASATPWKCMGWLHVGYWAGIVFYLTVMSTSVRLCLSWVTASPWGCLALYQGNGTAATEHRRICVICFVLLFLC